MNTGKRLASDRPTLAVIGFSVRAAAQCAIRQGFEVIAVDMCADRDLICFCQSHYRLDDPSWPDVLNSLHPSAPLLLAGGMEHRLQMVDRCHSAVQRYGPNGTQLAALRSLDNWARWAASCEIGWPVTVQGSSIKGDMSEQLLEGDWILKPFQSAGGIGITYLEKSSPSSDSYLGDHTKFYLQQRLPGESIGVTFLSSEFGSTLLGAAAAWEPDLKSPRKDYTYRGSYGPIQLSSGHIENLQRFAQLVHNESGILGLWQADFLDHEGELTLLEINPRWSASMDILDLCLDLRLVKMHYACISAKMSQAKFERFSTHASKRAKTPTKARLYKSIVYARAPFTVSQTQSDTWWLNRWQGDLNSVKNRIQFADIPCAGADIGNGHPILTVMSTSNSVNIAEVCK